MLEAPVPPVGSSAFLEYHIHLRRRRKEGGKDERKRMRRKEGRKDERKRMRRKEGGKDERKRMRRKEGGKEERREGGGRGKMEEK